MEQNQLSDPDVKIGFFLFLIFIALTILAFIYAAYLNRKKDKDCDFGDITAAALGKYVGDKLGINLGINSVSDLQKYMEKLGFDTGSSGYGKLMAEKVSQLINYLENIVNKIINSPYFWSIVKKYINTFSSEVIGKQINKDSDVYSKEFRLLPDFKVEYPMSIKSIKISKLNKDTVSLVGTIDMEVLATYGYYDTLDYTNVDFDVYMSWGFVEKVVKGKNCICLRFKVWDTTLNSSGIGFDKTYWTLSITDNVPNIDFGTLFGIDMGDVDLDPIDVAGFLKKEKLTFCIKYEDIIKLLVGEITMDKIKISNL